MRSHLAALAPLRIFLCALTLGCTTSCDFGGDSEKDSKKSESQSESNAASDSKSQAQALVVRIVQPERQSMDRSLPMTAKVEPLQEAEIAARVQGLRILKLLKDVGDPVTANEVVAVLDDTDLAFAEMEAKAALAEAQVRIQEAQFSVVEFQSQLKGQLRTTERKRQVWDRLKSEGRGVAQDDVEAAAYDTDTSIAEEKRLGLAIEKAKVSKIMAERARDRSQLTLEKAQRELKFAEVKAPIDGVITERLSQVGQVTAAGTPLYRMFDPKSIVAMTKLAQHHLRYIRKGQVVRFSGDAFPRITFVAEVALVEPTVDRENGMVGVRLRLDGPQTLAAPENAESLKDEEYSFLKEGLQKGSPLKPGMFVSGNIVLETREDVLTLPRKAVGYARGKPFIYVVDYPKSEGGTERPTVRRVWFKEGLASEGRVEFRPGSSGEKIAEADHVVLVGQDRLRGGDPVRIEALSSDKAEAEAKGSGN